MIHIDFASLDSFVNAVEILPGLPHRMLPTRIVTGHSTYRESAGNLWLPDRYFFGGLPMPTAVATARTFSAKRNSCEGDLPTAAGNAQDP
jgi:hypothetical protein